MDNTISFLILWLPDLSMRTFNLPGGSCAAAFDK
jgi:hypothetical protein